MILPYPLILASASPRRRELLEHAGFVFSVVAPPLHEPAPPEGPPITAAPWAEALAYFKARSVARHHPEAIIIGADTVVTHQNRIIGKARDEAEARHILSTMFAGPSRIITGLAVTCPVLDKRIITHEITSLVMRPMAEPELDDYIAGGAWRDKAGAYALQEGGDRFLQSLTGSESNVIGLPLEKLQQILSLFAA